MVHEDTDTWNAEISLQGEVTSVSKIKNKEEWVVNLKPSSLKVDLWDTENYPDDLPSNGDDDEKKSSTPEDTQGKVYKFGTEYLSAGDWLARTSDGCSKCGTDIGLVDSNIVAWHSIIEDGVEIVSVVCPECDLKRYKH